MSVRCRCSRQAVSSAAQPSSLVGGGAERASERSEQCDRKSGCWTKRASGKLEQPHKFRARHLLPQQGEKEESRVRSAILHPLRAAIHCGHTGAADLHQAERLHDAYELLDLRYRAGDLEDEMLCIGVDHLGAERLGKSERFNTVVTCARNLDQSQLARQRPGQDPKRGRLGGWLHRLAPRVGHPRPSPRRMAARHGRARAAPRVRRGP